MSLFLNEYNRLTELFGCDWSTKLPSKSSCSLFGWMFSLFVRLGAGVCFGCCLTSEHVWLLEVNGMRCFLTSLWKKRCSVSSSVSLACLLSLAEDEGGIL